MKTILTKFSLVSLISLMIALSWASQVQFGERPEIDITQVPDSAVYHTHIRIKFNEDLTVHLDNNPVSYDEEGFVLFNNPAIDALNRLFSVKEAIPLFASPALDNQYKERHRAWGFHLWYELRFPEDQDIREIVLAYDKLDIIAVSEPEYRKMLFADPAAEEDIIRWTPNDPQLGNQWHYNNTGQQSGTPGADISLFAAWDIEKGNSDVIVAIIDGGIDISHIDLAGNMWSGIGYNFVNNTPTISPHNHGTHVAGTVSAVNNNGIGVAGVAGGSGSGDGVRLMSCQVFTSTSSGGFHLAPVYAADNGAAISQNSWGYTSVGYYDQNVLDAIDYFNANGGGDALIGGITIFAAGNQNSSGAWYPGYYSGCFSVAATNNQDQRSWYSTYGTWVDISAPGGETNTVTERGVLSTLNGNTYGYYQGTSMACPHTSGVAALIISLIYGQLTPDDVAEIIRNTTDDHYAVNPSFIGQLGTGRLNAYEALSMALGLLGGVMNPQSFTTQTVSISQINLNWVRNINNDNVMVVWSADGNFGIPVTGMTYNAGDFIPGGGTVLYRGSNTSYSHTGLATGTMYYYRAYSYDASNEYSWGRSAQARTEALTAFTEDFNASGSLPTGWQIVDNQGNGQVWVIGTHTSGLSGTTGNYAYLNSDGYGSGNTQNSDLISPTINLLDYSEVILSFNNYFRHWSSETGTLSYSIDNGTTWTVIQTWNATTNNPSPFSQSIPAVGNQSQVKFKWNYTGSYGWIWCVDDVVVEVGGDGVETGNIEGAVTLVGGNGNVTDVLVQANNYTTNPDNNGNYILSVLTGSYNITATHPVYEPQSITNVIVNEGETTGGIDFDLLYIPQPEIAVDPEQFNVNHPYGGTTTRQLTIINDGEASLLFNIDSAATQLITVVNDHSDPKSPIATSERDEELKRGLRDNVHGLREEMRTDWLEVSPESATVPAGSSINVQVTFYATNLPSGTHNAELIISNNAGQDVIVPVTFIVTPPPGQITLGSGTSVNGTATAAPINIYYRSLRGQTVYTAAEINTAGFEGPGTLLQIGYYVQQSPQHDLPNFLVRMKHTTANNAASHDNGPFETVYSVASYSPTAGNWDMLILDTPFEWNGVDNILIDTAFSMVPNWNSSGQQRIYNQTSGFRYSWSDSSDQTNTTTNNTSNNKPQIRLLFFSDEPTELLPPENVSATISDGIVTLNWDPVDQATIYFVYVASNPYLPENEWHLEDITGSTYYSEPLSGEKRFYRIVAARGFRPVTIDGDLDLDGIRGELRR